MTFDARSRLFLFLCGIFVAALVVGDLIGCKLVEVTVLGKPFVLSMGIIPFPLTFLLTDVLNEFYGKQAARLVTWVGFTAAVFTTAVVALVLQLPYAPFTLAPDWGGATPDAFGRVFGSGLNILVASCVAYVLAQFIDIGVFILLKKQTHGRFLWLRATGSTLVSQLIDTIVIQSLAWSGSLELGRLVSLVLASYVVKLTVAIALTPAIYAVHALVEKVLKIPPMPPQET
ncbi:MAG: queuosine precursor transporter [Myxococcaceae bacterium]|nr:queuosine precursor transporter [Myxococcaceae bacterium]